MEPTIRDLIKNIGGDEQQIHSFNTQYNNIKYKHLLLPIWISAYRFKRKYIVF